MLGETSALENFITSLRQRYIDKGTITGHTGFALRSQVSYSKIFQLEIQAYSFDYMPFFSIIFGSGH